MDRTIVPTNLLSSPKVKNLIPDHKLIVLALWQNPFITPCGVYFIDLDMFSSMLGFTKLNVEQAIVDFEEKCILKFDINTSEILICDWWRFHLCKTPVQISIIQKSVDKIQSDSLKTEFFERIKHVSSKINDLRPNYNTTTTETNLTQPQQPQPGAEAPSELVPQVESGSHSFIYPKFLPLELHSQIGKIIVGNSQAQEILDELAAALEKKKVENPVAWVRAVSQGNLDRTPDGLLKTKYRLELKAQRPT